MGWRENQATANELSSFSPTASQSLGIKQDAVVVRCAVRRVGTGGWLRGGQASVRRQGAPPWGKLCLQQTYHSQDELQPGPAGLGLTLSLDGHMSACP